MQKRDRFDFIDDSDMPKFALSQCLVEIVVKRLKVGRRHWHGHKENRLSSLRQAKARMELLELASQLECWQASVTRNDLRVMYWD